MSEDYDWLFHEHSEYEELLSGLIEDAELHLWDECDARFADLVARLKVHMAMEEEVVYPAYGRLKDLPQEPIIALCREHDDIVLLVTDIDRILKNRDSEHFLEAIKPLEQKLYRHHEKEEDFFLPLAGHLLMPYRDQIVKDLKNFNPAKAVRTWPI